MRLNLDQIEARLQALIESSIQFLARGDAQQHLAHQLVTAAFENIVTDPGGRSIGPDRFTIYLHPESMGYWQNNSEQLSEIGDSLQKAAIEYGIHFASPPEIRLAADPRLAVEDMRVVADEKETITGHTAAFLLEPITPSQPAVPPNAFLIIDGSRIFPLNRTVINIGRRSDNHLILADPRISRSHAQIRAIRGQYVVFDLNSTGGTSVNGRRINQWALQPGDVISLSGVPLIYGEDSPADEEADEMGYTRSIHHPDGEPPEILE